MKNAMLTWSRTQGKDCSGFMKKDDSVLKNGSTVAIKVVQRNPRKATASLLGKASRTAMSAVPVCSNCQTGFLFARGALNVPCTSSLWSVK